MSIYEGQKFGRSLKQGRLDKAMCRIELALVIKAVRLTKGNKTKAAELLGCARTRIALVLKRNGLLHMVCARNNKKSLEINTNQDW